MAVTAGASLAPMDREPGVPKHYSIITQVDRLEVEAQYLTDLVLDIGSDGVRKEEIHTSPPSQPVSLENFLDTYAQKISEISERIHQSTNQIRSMIL